MKDLLLKVNKPARYSGGEYNTPSMNKPDALKVCLCFPDVYEVGMSNLGIKILYHMLNEQPDIRCERCFAPWPDMGGLLREEKLPLSSLETKTPLKGSISSDSPSSTSSATPICCTCSSWRAFPSIPPNGARSTR